MRDHARANGKPFDFAELEDEGVGNVILFGVGLAQIELSCLAVVIGESLRADAQFGSLFLGRKRSKPLLGRFTRTASFGS